MVGQCEICARKVLSIDYSVEAPRILRMTKRREPLRFGRVVGVGQRPRVNSVAVQDDGRGETVIQISEPSLPYHVREPWFTRFTQ